MTDETKKPFKFDDTAGNMKGKKAKKNHRIVQNHIDIKIKKGQDLEKVPNRFEKTLKSEDVI